MLGYLYWIYPWLLSLGILIFSLAFILFIHWRFGLKALPVYMTMTSILSGIQVLKIVEFPIIDMALPLGTVLCTTSFFCSDLINEYYGPKQARKAVFISFYFIAFWNVMTSLTLLYPPIAAEQLLSTTMTSVLDVQPAMERIFLQLPSIFLAGLISYVISQLFDISLYQFIRNQTKNRFVWLRNNLSTFCSALLDNLLFSILAWIVFNPNPLPIKFVIINCVFATLWIRFACSLLSTPFLYLSFYITEKKGHPLYES